MTPTQRTSTTSPCPYLQEDSTVSVDIGPWVLGLPMLRQHPWSDLKQLGDYLEEGIVREVLLGKLALAHVARIRLAQHSMTKPWHHLGDEAMS